MGSPRPCVGSRLPGYSRRGSCPWCRFVAVSGGAAGRTGRSQVGQRNAFENKALPYLSYLPYSFIEIVGNMFFLNVWDSSLNLMRATAFEELLPSPVRAPIN